MFLEYDGVCRGRARTKRGRGRPTRKEVEMAWKVKRGPELRRERQDAMTGGEKEESSRRTERERERERNNECG